MTAKAGKAASGKAKGTRKGTGTTRKKPTGNPPGRPPEITNKLIEKAVEYTRLGVFQVTVFTALGVKERTWFRWLEIGHAMHDPDHDKYKPPSRRTRRDLLCMELVAALPQAEAVGEIEAVTDIRDGVNRWQSRAWFLERRYKERWGATGGQTDHGKIDSLVEAIQSMREAG
jgi:hypothetical protein